MKTIEYFVDCSHENALWSRCDKEVLYSSISYEPYSDEENSFEAYECVVNEASMSIFHAYHYLQEGKGRWTRKVPVEWKNAHRKFWGFPPLKDEKAVPEWYIDEVNIHVPTIENVEDFPEQLTQWALSHGAKRKHWYGQRDCFKTWVFSVPLDTVVSEVVPLLVGSDFVVKLKSW